MVVDQGLAADKGSQLIFQSNMAHQNYISIANAHSGKAVTVLVQYYNDAMERVLWYLRVLPADGNALIDPFNAMVPGSDPATNSGDFIMATGKANSGHFVIAVTAVGASVAVDIESQTEGEDPVNTANTASTANVPLPDLPC